MIETRKIRLTTKGKTTRKKKKQKAARLPLRYHQRQVLVEFLNHDFSRPLKHDRSAGYIDENGRADDYVDANGRQVSPELHMIIYGDLSSGSLEHLEGIRQHLIAVLLPIADPPLGFKQKRIYDCLLSITAKLNQMRFEPVFRVVAGEKETARPMLSRDQRIFSRGSGKWIIAVDFRPSISYSPERDFYGMIAEGLLKGELDLLRRCLYCKKFFTAKQRREIFCVPEHGRLYYDEPKRAKQRVDKSRGSVADQDKDFR